MHPLSYFRSYTDETGELRGDPMEGSSAFFSSGANVSVKLLPTTDGTPTIDEELTLSPEGIVHMHIAPNRVLAWNVFCLYRLMPRGFERRSEVTAETLSEFKRSLSIHQSNFGLGGHLAVIRNGDEFFRRVDQAIKTHPDITGGVRGPVEYYDETTWCGRFGEERIPFMKRSCFREQNEYRIVAKDYDPDGKLLILNIGDLSDIVTLTTPCDFENLLTIQLPDGSTA